MPSSFKTAAAIYALTMLATSPANAASSGAPSEASAPCDPAKTTFQLRKNSLSEPFKGTKGTCTGLAAVINWIPNNAKAGGRKLEGDRALNVSEAQKERSSAQADPEFQAALQQALDNESDTLRRLALEAAVLHDFGFYAARDLIIEQIRGAIQ